MEKTDKVIDWVAAFEMAGGKQKLAIKIMELFANKIPEEKKLLMNFWAQGDLVNIQKFAHRNLGMSDTCRLRVLDQALLNLKSISHEQNINEREALYYAALNAFDEFVEYFEKERKYYGN